VFPTDARHGGRDSTANCGNKAALANDR
jgi:hypothetical protein